MLCILTAICEYFFLSYSVRLYKNKDRYRQTIVLLQKTVVKGLCLIGTKQNKILLAEDICFDIKCFK